MCTLILLDRVVPGFPIVVAANRDEFYARPAAPPARIEPGSASAPAFVAPQDLEAGGTWMGLNAAGLFCGLTNRPADTKREGTRSRGELVMRGLAARRAEDLARELGDELHATYNPCHLLWTDGSRTGMAVVRSGVTETRWLQPGRHVVCNRDPGDPASSKVARIQAAVDALELSAPIERVLRGLGAVLGSHAHDRSNPFENPCVHTPEYGTRSSALLAVGEDRSVFWHADGPPCDTKYRNLTRLLDDLQPAPTPGD